MSFNLAFGYIKNVLSEDGPLTQDEINGQLSSFGADVIGRVLKWALDNNSLILVDGRYELTARGRR